MNDERRSDPYGGSLGNPPAGPSARAADAMPEMPPPKVLIVDDTAAKRIRNRIILKKLDCEVIEACSGAEGLAHFEQTEFAAIVLDVHMPGMDGFEVAAAMSAHERGRDTPIIFCSSQFLDDASRVKAYGTGAVDYIVEPSDETILLSKVRVFLELYRSRQKLQWLLSERTRLEELARYEASHDGLTGLPNRRLYMDRLEHTIRRAARRKTRFAVFFIDLDHFKPVNDLYGHPVGDELLKAVARRMTDNLRQTDTVARFGGDEFAGVLDEPVSGADAMNKISRFCALLAQPYELQVPGDGPPITAVISASIGVSIFPDDSTDAEALITAADNALYRAKRQGKNLCLGTDLGSTNSGSTG